MSAEPGRHKCDFGFLYRNGLHGKKGTGERRAAFALDLIDDVVKKFVPDPESRAAITSARKFLKGEIDQQQLFKARKLASQAFHRRVEQDCPNSMKVMAHTAYLATMAGEHLNSILEEIENIVAWRAHETQSAPSKEAADAAIEDYFARALKHLMRHLPAEMEANWRKSMKQTYCFDDPRFAMNRWVPLDYSHVALSDEVRRSERFQSWLRVLDAFQACQHQPEIESKHLQMFVEVLRGDNTHQRTMVLTMVIPIAWHFECARHVLLEFLADRRGQVRFEVISSFRFYGQRKYPRPFVATFLARALDDRSAKNRHFAAEAAARSRCIEVLPQLEELTRTETTAKARKAMAENAELVRDGFSVSDGLNPGQVSVWFYTKRCYTCINLDQDEYARMSLEDVRLKVEAQQKEDETTGW